MVCAVLSQRLRRPQFANDHPWSTAAVTAVEFFPAPVLAGQLMAYLAQFADWSIVARALINFAAVAAAATLAHAVPDDYESAIVRTLPRLTSIVRQTLGFGLGIAWNTLLAEVLAPHLVPVTPTPERPDASLALVGYGGYLAAMALLALRLAAWAATPQTPPTWGDRQRALLAFAAQVVCAFTLVTLLQAMPFAGNVPLESLALLVLLSAVATAAVAGMEEEEEASAATRNSNSGDASTTATTLTGPAQCLVFLPCVWCCCPWLPLLLVLAGTTPPTLLREAWLALVAMVSGLAASITAANLLTSLTDALARGFCTAAACRQPILFLVLQTGVALGTTVVVLAAVAPLTPPPTTPGTPRRDEEARLLV
jgi:hypothetical protein